MQFVRLQQLYLQLQLQQRQLRGVAAMLPTSAPDRVTALRSALVQPCCGFATGLQVTLTDVDEPMLTLAHVNSRSSGRTGSSRSASSPRVLALRGAGAGRNGEEATLPALAELVERHATSTYHEGQFVWQSADKLQERALDLNSIPCCSERERMNPRCSLQLARKSEPIRWVRGLSLLDGEVILVPAVMVYSHAGWRGPQERFWLPISTGCAAHSSYAQAVMSAICEVVERDAISLVWLQQLTLPRINLGRPGPDVFGSSLEAFWNLYQDGSADVENLFFDATTDLGLPTIYGVQVSRHHPFARNIVACATARTFEQALLKTMQDLIAFKRAFSQARTVPTDTGAFTGLLDGATYMARPEHAAAFDFLLKSGHEITLRELSDKTPELQTLECILRRFADSKMQVIAVDLSTDESLRAGLFVVRVIIPALQPLSLHTASQFLGHARLYDAPRKMGFPVRKEEQLNPWPQPFA